MLMLQAFLTMMDLVHLKPRAKLTLSSLGYFCLAFYHGNTKVTKAETFPILSCFCQKMCHNNEKSNGN